MAIRSNLKVVKGESCRNRKHVRGVKINGAVRKYRAALAEAVIKYLKLRSRGSAVKTFVVVLWGALTFRNFSWLFREKKRFYLDKNFNLKDPI